MIAVVRVRGRRRHGLVMFRLASAPDAQHVEVQQQSGSGGGDDLARDYAER